MQQSSAFMLATGMLLKSSVVAVYWKKWSARLLAACLLSRLKKLQGKNACLLVFYHVNYLPFDQCFPSLWTLLVFCETKKIDKILKTKTKQHEGPHSVDHLSNALLLLTSAAEGHTLLLSSACSNWGSVYENGAFEMHLPIFTGRFSQGWNKGMKHVLIAYKSSSICSPDTGDLLPTSLVWEHQEFQTKHIAFK